MSMDDEKMICLNFSGRVKNGNGIKVCNYIKEKKGGDVEICNVVDFNIHGCNKCLYECLQEKRCPYEEDDVRQLYDSLLIAETILFVIPVYSDFPCSNYFIFRERMQFYFDDLKYKKFEQIEKKFIIIGNTGIDNVKTVIKNDFIINDNKDILFLSSNDVKTKSVYGDLMSYSIMQEKIVSFMFE